MTDVSLSCHPTSDAGSVKAVEIAIARGENGRVEAVYRVVGALDMLEIVGRTAPDRRDELWKTTCFELFIGTNVDSHYLEYNFAPSRQWAAYKFSDYRAEMGELDASTPQIEVVQGDHILSVTVSLQLPEQYWDGALRVGISAILAAKTGAISYWALAHPPGKPDFHHKDCFALQLEARSAA